jgi:hypothetical protein
MTMALPLIVQSLKNKTSLPNPVNNTAEQSAMTQFLKTIELQAAKRLKRSAARTLLGFIK